MIRANYSGGLRAFVVEEMREEGVGWELVGARANYVMVVYIYQSFKSNNFTHLEGH